MIEGDCDVPVRDASHWSYAASVMANHCAHIASRGATDPAVLPEGVRISLHQFLVEALEALDEDDLHSDALHVARDALDAALHPPLRKSAEVRKYLRIVAEVVSRCATPQSFTDEQHGYARKAIAFFQAIVRAGDSADVHRAFADDELDELEFA